MIQATALIYRFQYALDNRWGYIYGKTHEMWSEEKQKTYAREYANDPDRATSVEYGGKWAGHWVTDCSGLFAWSFKELGGSIAHGSNSIWNSYCASKGTLSKGERTDGKLLRHGTAVFTSTGDKHNHIGLYVGNGMVIEAHGTLAGVVTSLITNKKWTHWGELKGIQYQQQESEEKKDMKTAKVVLPGGRTGNTVRMRTSRSTENNSNILLNVPVGSTVSILEDYGEWCKIEYDGKTGYMLSDYLEYGQSDETAEAITTEQADAINAALKQIENAVDKIGSVIGRG